MIILAFIFFIVFIMLAFNKRQLVLKKNIQILELNQEKNILNAQLEIQENTFKKISQEIHDNISLSLTLAKLHLNTLSLVESANGNKQIESSVDLISKALQDLNDISKSLDSDVIEHQGLIHALENEAELIRKAGIHQVTLSIEGTALYMDSSKELLIFRMIQEACNNILKHAEASIININLHYEPNTLSIQVCDNGKGFDLQEAEHQRATKRSAGIKNIQKRASLMNARIAISSSPACGTIISLHIPIETTNENGPGN